MSWIIYALSAAVLWGFAYAFYGQVLKSISVSSVIIFTHLAVGLMFLVHNLFSGGLLRDFEVITSNNTLIKNIVLLILFSAVANFCLFSGMQAKNATLAGLLEVSYPFFTALVAWALFKDAHLTWGTALGGLLIISGVICIIYFENAR